ncbi:hypothetical protein ABZ403_01350 [Micromonospora zamorensis]|uniref:hypothetical protein n=1 Tax=Micromonospora zamorensis TaxID=709883 RepID=UPI00340D8112
MTLCRLADPHEADGGDRAPGRAVDIGGEGRLSRRDGVEVPPAFEHRYGVLGAEVELGDQGLRSDVAQLEVEVGDDAEGAAPAA